MELLISGLRVLHVAAGFVALGIAPIAMATSKGGVARPNLFLTMIAVFSFYAAFSGYRVLRRKRPEVTPPAVLDWAMASVTLAVSAALVALGTFPPSPAWESLRAVSMMLGGIGMVLAGRDLYTFVRPPTDRTAWWFAHMGGMLGSYIAVMTAFSVVNFTFLPLTVRWLWPSWIGTPLIALWIGSYRRLFRRAPATAAHVAQPTSSQPSRTHEEVGP